MVAKYVQVTENLFHDTIGARLIESHNKWVITGEDNLISDSLFVFAFKFPLLHIIRDVSDHIKYPSVDKLDDGTHRMNWFMKEPYIIDQKKDTSFIMCGNQATLGIFHFIKKNPNDSKDILQKKKNIVMDAIWNTLLPIWGDKLSRVKEGSDKQSRNDIMINGKKISGHNWMNGETRADLDLGIQNIFTPVEEETINTFMIGDKQWGPNLKAADIITGGNFRIDDFMANLQSEVDKVYYSI